MCDEKWRWVVGYEGLYMVSDAGRVFSMPKLTRTYGQIMNPQLEQNGYLSVKLRKEGSVNRIGVHRLVAGAFIKKVGDRNEVNHINGCKTDNRVSNLEWVTPSENHLHAYRVLGRKATVPRLDESPRRKLTQEQATRIRADNRAQRVIASEYGVSQGAVSLIKRGITYKEKSCQSIA